MDTSEGTLKTWETGHTPFAGRFPKVIEFLGEEPWPAPTTYAERLRVARWRRGLTIEEAAAALEVVPSTLWWWEHGREPRRRAQQQLVADFIGAELTQGPAVASCTEEVGTPLRLADALRTKRRELQLTQQAAAASMEINTWTYLGWEQGRRIPPDRYYPTLIHFLGHEPWPEPRTQGARLRAERLRRGLTRDQLAAVLVVDPASLSVWEDGDGPRHQLAKNKVAAFLEGRGRPIRARRTKQRVRKAQSL